MQKSDTEPRFPDCQEISRLPHPEGKSVSPAHRIDGVHGTTGRSYLVELSYVFSDWCFNTLSSCPFQR